MFFIVYYIMLYYIILLGRKSGGAMICSPWLKDCPAHVHQGHYDGLASASASSWGHDMGVYMGDVLQWLVIYANSRMVVAKTRHHGSYTVRCSGLRHPEPASSQDMEVLVPNAITIMAFVRKARPVT